MYSPVQPLKALIPAVFTLTLLGFSEQKRSREERGSPTLTLFKVSSSDFYHISQLPLKLSPHNSLCWLAEGWKQKWQRKRGNLRELSEQDEDGRNERITAKLEWGGLRGSCRGGRITFRSRGGELSRLLWQLCSPAQPLASCLSSFQWQDSAEKKKESTEIFSISICRAASLHKSVMYFRGFIGLDLEEP